MYLLINNLKIALRNLLKYKLQTIISVLSIAIGIVTLAAVHCFMERFQLPAICGEPYYERAYYVYLDSINKTSEHDRNVGFRNKYEYIKALRADDGLPSVEGEIVFPNGYTYGAQAHFHLGSIERKIGMEMIPIDASYARHEGLHSAITGEKVKSLKKGEAIISETTAHKIFGSQCPIGATTEYNIGGIEIPLTIVDVYKDVSIMETIIQPEWLMYGVGEHMETLFEEHFFNQWLEVVLKENSTPHQLEKEINARLKPYGIHCKDVKSVQQKNSGLMGVILMSQVLVHVIGSLILLAAIIGFLRMQTQLFWMRRREISLRITNGANQWQMFMMLMTEVSIVIVFSTVMSVLLGIWLNDFIMNHLSDLLNEIHFNLSNLYIYIISVSIALSVICSVIVWIVLHRIYKSEQGLEQAMHASRSHLFRNVMLGSQIVISMLFVCGTLQLVQVTSTIIGMENIPDNDDDYKQMVLLKAEDTNDSHRLIEELGRLADVKQTIPFTQIFCSFKEILDYPDVINKLERRTHFYNYMVADTAMLNLYGMEVKWFPGNTDRSRCIVLSDPLYQKLDEAGLTSSGMLTPVVQEFESTLPIAGTYKAIPYIKSSNTEMSCIIIAPELTPSLVNAIVVPREGKYRKVMREVNETAARLEPMVVRQMVFNLRDDVAPALVILETMRTGAWILGIISIIICAMSVYSTIALNTRSRRKEVAIRKVHGAGRKDIIILFGKIYGLLAMLGIIITVPCSLLLYKLILMAFGDIDFSPAIAICIGILAVVMLIFLIVGWHIKKVMKVECEEIIAKE